MWARPRAPPLGGSPHIEGCGSPMKDNKDNAVNGRILKRDRNGPVDSVGAIHANANSENLSRDALHLRNWPFHRYL